MPEDENAEEWWQELFANAVIVEGFERACEAATELRRQLDRLAEHDAAQKARLADEERQNDQAERELGEIGTARLSQAAADAKASAIEKTRRRIAADRATLVCQRGAGEALFVLQCLDKLGIDPELVPCLNARRLAAFDHGSSTVPASELRRRAMYAAALSVMLAHGWKDRGEAATTLAAEARRRGADIEAADIIEWRRDLRTNPARQKAKETKPTMWRAALDAIEPTPMPRRPALGLAPIATPGPADPTEQAQRRFDETFRHAEWFYAAEIGEGAMSERDAAWRAARLVLDLIERGA